MRAIPIVLAILLVSVGVAEAQDKKAAEKAFNEAQKAYAAGNYPAAVQGFLQAYQLVPVNPLLFNIGQAYRLSGDPEKALSYYEKYVAFEPNGPQVPEAKDHIQKLREEIETAKRDKEREDAERLTLADAEAKRAEAERQQREAQAAAARAEANKAGSGLRTAGLVVAGAGVVAAGVGVALYSGADSKAMPAALIGAGAAGIAAGTTMYLIGRKKRSNAMKAAGVAMVVPQITGDTVGVAWITVF
jgi:tetratricopeptide (TPR) repeat protein